MIPSILERWLISRAHQQGRPLSAWLRRRIDRSPTLRRYCASLSAVETALRASVPAADAPDPALARRIADALARPATPPSPRLLPLWWLGGASVAAVLVAVLVARSDRTVRPSPPPHQVSAALPGLPSELRQGPIYALVRPVNHRWESLATQTRRSVSGFIRDLPGLPLGPRPERRD